MCVPFGALKRRLHADWNFVISTKRDIILYLIGSCNWLMWVFVIMKPIVSVSENTILNVHHMLQGNVGNPVEIEGDKTEWTLMSIGELINVEKTNNCFFLYFKVIKYAN